MPNLTAEDIHLTFPLYSVVDISNPGHAVEDARIVRGPGNRLLGVRALQGISFELNAGDRLALIGRNGSGKTTLLHVLSGLLPPDRGKVTVVGRATNLINISFGLRGEASGHRNITLQGLASGRTRKEIEIARPEIADFTELGDFLDMPIETYSAGMRVRLSFAIATAFKPDVLLLDEWLSAGDAAFRSKASERMTQFVETAGILVLASHSRQLILQNCNRAAWIDGGRIRMLGDVEDVLNAYEAN